MLEDQLEPDERRVFDLAFEILGDAPLPAEELVDRIRAAGGWAHLDDADDDELVEELIDVLTVTDRFWVREPPLVHRVDLLLEGVVLTHRLTEREVERGGIELEPDIGVIDFDFDHDTDVVVGDQVVATELEPDENWFAWVFPDGLPAECLPGDLVAIRRIGSAFELLHGPELDTAVVAADSGEVISALAPRLDQAAEEGVGFESTEAVMSVLCWSPGAFSSPLPPVSELLADAGASRQGDYFGPADAEWELPGARFVRAMQERLFRRWGFGECCEEAFDLVDDAWQAHARGDESPYDPAEIRSALAHSAVSLAVLENWEDLAAEPEQIQSFLAPVVATTRRDAAPALHMVAVTLERSGRALEAEKRYEQAVLADADFVPPSEALGLYAFERGDLERARLLLDRSAEPGRHHPVAELLAELAPPAADVGRNDPCPCGSGRKFKVCHLGKSLGDGVSEAKLLLQKALIHLHRRDGRLLDELLFPFGVDAERLVEDEFVADVAVFEAGSLVGFLQDRAGVLPPGEQAEGQLWAATPRRLYEVVEDVPGERLDLRDLTSGDRMVVEERLGSVGRQAGDYLLARVVRPDSEPAIIGLPIEVPMRSRDALLEVLDAGADAVDLIAWYEAATAPPRIQNRSGEDFVICELTVDPGVEGTDEVAAGLDVCFGADARKPDGSMWDWTVTAPQGTEGERLVAGQISWEDGVLECSTNSEERADELVAMLLSVFPNLAVEDDVRTPIDEVPVPDGDGSPLLSPADAPPEVQAAMREHIRAYEESWVDEPIPALEGMTPRQAVQDPTRREDVERLLAGMPSDQDGLLMDTSRVRMLLGIDED
jgi:hypothetical protein